MDRARASKLTYKSFNNAILTNGLITIDSAPVPAGAHWILDSIWGIVWSSAGAADIAGNGIFLMPDGSPLNAHGGDATFRPEDLPARGIAIGLDSTSWPLQGPGNGGPTFPQVWRFVADNPRGIIVPGGYFIRLAMHGAFVAPPGATGILAFTCVQEDDCD